MSENASVIVFPSIFSKNKINSLVSNIKSILKIKDQKYETIRRDDSVIVIEANDPVFTSSAVNLLFGIERVAIAKKVKNEFDTIVSSITKIGSNLVLKGDRFFVKIEGYSSGYLPKDLEIAATSSLIEKTAKLGARPGTEQNYDKLLYTYLTKKHAYVCIFTDKGLGGIPYNSQKERMVCGIFDELSAISCLEAIKQGFDVVIVVFYNRKSELLKLAKILNRILPRTLHSRIELLFYQIPIKSTSTKNFLLLIQTVTEILISVAKSNKMKKVSLSVSPLIFPSQFFDNNIQRVFEKNLSPYVPLAGLDDDILDNAREIGLGKFLKNIEKFGKMKFDSIPSQNEAQKIAKQSIGSKKTISIILGSNNIHDILDSLE